MDRGCSHGKSAYVDPLLPSKSILHADRDMRPTSVKHRFQESGMKIMGFIILSLLAAAQIYVRMTPLPGELWHVDPFEASAPKMGGVLERFVTPHDVQTTLDTFMDVAQSTPRTKVLVGSTQEARISFVTRSLLWGFPDVTTIGLRETDEGTEVAILARLRFGKGDMGVNANRVANWRAAAGL